MGPRYRRSAAARRDPDPPPHARMGVSVPGRARRDAGGAAGAGGWRDPDPERLLLQAVQAAQEPGEGAASTAPRRRL